MNSADTCVLETIGLSRSYLEGPAPVTVLSDIDLRIGVGERIAVVGASGSGKSTLLHLLGGLDTPTAGEVRIMGKSFSTMNESERAALRNQTLGFVYQFHHLLPEFSALENVAMPLLIRKEPSRIAFERAARVLESVGLAHRLSHRPSELSGGERQRTAIARAMVTEPKCIIADEPTGNLDYHNAQQVMALLLELNRERQTSLIMATHDLELAARLDRSVRLLDGRIVAD